MALSWTQDRLGPICRYAEDNAIVMQAIAKPDGRDMSVSDVPFNYNAQFDIKKLKVGIIQDSFDTITNASAKANAEKMLQTFRSLGVTQFIPIEVPVFPVGTGSFGVERAAYFDEHARAGRMKGTRGGGSPAPARLIPAPEYLQQQRARMMMMMELAKSTAHVDVYIVGSNNTGVGGPPARERRTRHAAAGAAARSRAVTDAAPLRLREPRGLSRDQFAEWVCGYRRSDQRRDLRAAVPRARDSRAREGVSGRCRVPSDQADETGSDNDDAAAITSVRVQA